MFCIACYKVRPLFRKSYFIENDIFLVDDDFFGFCALQHHSKKRYGVKYCIYRIGGKMQFFSMKHLYIFMIYLFIEEWDNLTVKNILADENSCGI